MTATVPLLQPRYFRSIPLDQLTASYVRWLADAPLHDAAPVGLAGFGVINSEAVHGKAPLDKNGRIVR